MCVLLKEKIMRKFIVELSEQDYQRLVRTADGHIPEDYEGDFNVNDYACGNIDDAYDIGRDHESVVSARKLLSLLKEVV
jgi:hypothetical protein